MLFSFSGLLAIKVKLNMNLKGNASLISVKLMMNNFRVIPTKKDYDCNVVITRSLDPMISSVQIVVNQKVIFIAHTVTNETIGDRFGRLKIDFEVILRSNFS